MRSKKVTSVVTSLVLVGLIGIGATLAYLSDKASSLNTFEVGEIKIELTESSTTPGAVKGENGIEFTEPVLPGDIVSKKPVVTLDSSSQDAYLRVKVEVKDVENAVSLPLGAKNDIINDIKKSMEDRNWVYSSDGYFYYQGDDTENGITTASKTDGYTLFETVHFNGQWKNEVKGAKFTIDIKAEAIQVKNFTSNLEIENSKIVGWGNVTIE